MLLSSTPLQQSVRAAVPALLDGCVHGLVVESHEESHLLDLSSMFVEKGLLLKASFKLLEESVDRMISYVLSEKSSDVEADLIKQEIHNRDLFHDVGAAFSQLLQAVVQKFALSAQLFEEGLHIGLFFGFYWQDADGLKDKSVNFFALCEVLHQYLLNACLSESICTVAWGVRPIKEYL